MTILTEISHIAQRCPDQICLIHHLSGNNSVHITFKELARQVDLLADILMDRGVQKGQYVGIYMQRSIEHIIAMIAIWKCGAAFFSLNPKLSHYQIDYTVNLCGAPILLIDNGALIKLTMIESDQLTQTKLIHFSHDVQSPIHRACMDKLHQRIDIESISISDFDSPPVHQFPNTTGNDVAVVLFTSGSTGRPKGVMISHYDLLSRIVQERKDFQLTDSDKLLNLLPFSFDVGLNQLFTALTGGIPLIICNSWLATDICNAIKHHNISGISAVPAIWNELLNYDENEVRDCLKRLRYFTVSGGDMAPDHLLRLRKIAPDTAIYKTYGQTETFRSSILMPEDFDSKSTSVGKPVNGTEIVVINDSGQRTDCDEAGEIIHYGVGTMMGYVNDPEATEGKIRSHPLSPNSTSSDHLVVFTGDIGKIDEDGYLYILGREDRMIKTRGNRVYPQEVLNVVLSFDHVRDAVVFAVKDQTGDSLIYAEVVLKNGSSLFCMGSVC